MGDADMGDTELVEAKQELKGLIDLLYRKVDSVTETEDDFELNPHQNIIDNFAQRNAMSCPKCEILFNDWHELDTHNSMHHEHAAGNPRICDVCQKVFANWQERDTHVLVQHPIDSRTFQAGPTMPIKTLLCCSICCKHFVDEDHWQKHYQITHASYMGWRHFNWMFTVCDIKGRGIVNDDKAVLLCNLCDVDFPYNPDIFHFDSGHGKTRAHKTAVKNYIKEKNRLPVKFLKIVNCRYEVTGMFHPHELQSSCCCRVLACEFCGMHKAMVTKHPDGVVMLCTVCNSNIKWDNIHSGIEHVKSDEHFNKLCAFVSTHNDGMQPEFNAMFKKQGQSISAVSFSRRT